MRTMTVLIAVTMAACVGGGERAAVQAVAGPAIVTVTTTPVAGELALSWSADTAGPFKYYVFQSTNGPSGPFAFVTSVLDPSAQPPAPTSYVASGLAPGQYCYAIESAYTDGSMSELGAAGCGTALGVGTPAPGTTHRRNVPLVLQWANPTNMWTGTDVGVRSLSTGGITLGATSIDVPFEVGEVIVGAEVWRFSDGTAGRKAALLALAAGNDVIIAAGDDSIDSSATTRSIYSIPQAAGNHAMVAGERLRLVLFARPSPGYTIDSVNLLYTAAP